MCQIDSFLQLWFACNRKHLFNNLFIFLRLWLIPVKLWLLHHSRILVSSINWKNLILIFLWRASKPKQGIFKLKSIIFSRIISYILYYSKQLSISRVHYTHFILLQVKFTHILSPKRNSCRSSFFSWSPSFPYRLRLWLIFLLFIFFFASFC